MTVINATHNRQYILRKLEISDLRYCQEVEDVGYMYLHRYFSYSPEAIESASKSELFWKWWINQWEIRDNEFVQQTCFRMPWPKETQRRIYDSFHDVKQISIVPNRFVIDEIRKLMNEKIIQGLYAQMEEAQ